MHYQRREGLTPVGVLVRLLLPSIATGTALWIGARFADATGGTTSLLLFIFGGFAVLAVVAFGATRPALGFAAAALLMCSGAAWLAAVEFELLTREGLRGDCRVVGIARKTVQETIHTQDGLHTTTRTVHVHTLACPRGGPDHLTRPGRFASPGDTVQVVWDPHGRVSPLREIELGDSDRMALVAHLALCFAWVLLLVDAFQDLRHPEDEERPSFQWIARMF